MGVRQRGDASSYGLCSSCYEGLALGALNAWTHRLLDVLKRVGVIGTLFHTLLRAHEFVNLFLCLHLQFKS